MRPFFGIIQFDFALLHIIIAKLCQSENENLSKMCYFVAVESGFQESPGWSHSKLVENQQHISPLSEKHKIQVKHENFPVYINNPLIVFIICKGWLWHHLICIPRSIVKVSPGRVLRQK